MRLLHTMLRVGDLERSIKFYHEVFGLEVIKNNDYPDGKFTLVFLGYPNQAASHQIELTYNYGVTHYDIGTAYGHLAFEVEDIYARCELATKFGYMVTRTPGPMKHGTTLIAFITDPDGYKVELIQH